MKRELVYLKMSKIGIKEIFWMLMSVIIYIVSGVITGLLYDTSSATILLPIIVYIFFNLLITHALDGEEEKRLIDLNNVALLSYGISYILYGLIYKFIELPYKNEYFMKASIFLLLLLVFIFITMFLLYKLSNKEWLNNKTSSEKDEQ